MGIQPTDVDGLAGVATTLVFEFLNGYYETEDGERLHKAELLDRAVIEPRHLMVLKAKASFGARRADLTTQLQRPKRSSWKIQVSRAYKEIGLSNLYLG